MIHVYAMTYWAEDYAKKSIASLKAHTQYPFRLTVVENKSPKDLSHLRGETDCWIQLETNAWETSLKLAYMIDPPRGDIIVFTDLDLLIPDGVDWVEEVIKRLSYPEVGLVAFDLDTINYVPPNHGQLMSSQYLARYDAFAEPSGMWLATVRRAEADRFMETCVVSLDSFLMRSVSMHLRVPVPLYHLGWDTWKDYPEYFEKKQVRIKEMRAINNWVVKAADQLRLRDFTVWRKEDDERYNQIFSEERNHILRGKDTVRLRSR